MDSGHFQDDMTLQSMSLREFMKIEKEIVRQSMKGLPKEDLLDASVMTELTEIVASQPGQNTIEREKEVRVSFEKSKMLRNQNFLPASQLVDLKGEE